MTFSRTRRIPLATWAALLGLVAAAMAPSLAQTTSPTATPSPEAMALLQRIEKRFADARTIQAQFDQVRFQPDFDDRTRSAGRLIVELPDRLRAEYDSPDPSVVLLTSDAFYQYTPTLKQVDMTRFASPEEARRRLRAMLLGFGLSSSEVLESYDIATVDKDGPGLVFRPRRKDVADLFSEIRVWFDPKALTPRKVRIEETGGDVVTLGVKSVRIDEPVDAGLLRPDFPKGVEIIDHSSPPPEAESKARKEP